MPAAPRRGLHPRRRPMGRTPPPTQMVVRQGKHLDKAEDKGPDLSASLRHRASVAAWANRWVTAGVEDPHMGWWRR